MTKKIIAFTGAQATGKTTAALRLVHFFKTNNLNAIFVESASNQSFYLASGDICENMHIENVLTQSLNEIRAMRKHDIVVTDRSVFDFVAYAIARYGDDSECSRYLKNIAMQQVQFYNKIYFFDQTYDVSKQRNPSFSIPDSEIISNIIHGLVSEFPQFVKVGSRDIISLVKT